MNNPIPTGHPQEKNFGIAYDYTPLDLFYAAIAKL